MSENKSNSETTERIKALLQNLVGSGFTVSITVAGGSFTGLKVVTVDDGLVYTVTLTGVVNVFVIADIEKVNF